MPTVTLPDDERLDTLARERGFADTAAFVQHLVERAVSEHGTAPRSAGGVSEATEAVSDAADTGDVPASVSPDQEVDWEERRRKFREFIASMPDRDVGFVDDSRESIYD